MGVPKFYRWISERYPLINQIITDTSILPEIDNFYLDMNGIIHACTHPNDSDMSKSLTMREMMLGIFRYIDRMVTEIVRPKKVLFMAIDGVAPRAKLNQQRARRFRSAQDREDNLIKARQRGDIIDEDAIFDSNCITPGTEFMDAVGKHLRWFIRKKIKEDALWRNLQVIFSGHDVPGEGEHKIMEFIRQQRALPGYQPNQRHCMYGQDADLIMLGLVSHEPNFTLLREVVHFNTKPSSNTRQTVLRQTKEAQFQLLHIAVLRQYIEVDLAIGCKWEVNKERLIDDFILLTFLVGNDFLPHLPTLDISEHAFDVIFDAYKELLIAKPGYITKEGSIDDYERLESLFHSIGQQENEILRKRDEDVKKFNAKRSRYPQLLFNSSLMSPEDLEEEEERKQQAYEEAILEALGVNANSSDVKDTESNNNPISGNNLVKDFRGRYYYEKFHFILLQSESNHELDELMRHYLQGLMWCLAYYVKGCISWKWYYPYHYGPMLQDMNNLRQHCNQITFDLGEPFLPFQQLLGCLPPLSKRLVPAPYQWLMTNPSSPVLQFYPTEFRIDQDGKKNPWEAVVLLPFIDETILLEAEATYCPSLTLSEYERKRNTFGMISYISYDPNNLETYPSCNPMIQLQDIVQCQSTQIDRLFTLVPGPSFKAELITGTVANVAGFPSMGSLPIVNVSIDYYKINVFGSDSKYRNIMIQLESKTIDPKSIDLKILLGKSVYVNYPILHEARVIAVTTREGEYRLIKTSSLPIDTSVIGKSNTTKPKSIAMKIMETMNAESKKMFKGTIIEPFGDGSETICYELYDSDRCKEWMNETEIEMKRYMKGRGIPGSAGLLINNVVIRLKVQVLQGMKLNITTGARTKVFGQSEADIPLQLAAWQPLCLDMRFQETEALPLEKYMPYGSQVIAIKGSYCGLLGNIVGPHSPESSMKSSKKKNKSIKSTDRVVDVEFKIPSPYPETPFGYAIAATITDKYYPSKIVCKQCDITPQILGMIVGSLYVEPGRHDIGLNLKKNGQYQLYEYVRKVEMNDDNSIKRSQAWSNGDSVQIIGNMMTSMDNDDNEQEQGNERVIWEYSDKAITLIKSYKSRFPMLFMNLNRLENSKIYTISQLFGSLAVNPLTTPDKIIEEVLCWMKEQPYYNLQRTPLSTVCLSLAAMKAIEKAADLRVAQVKGNSHETVIVKNIPVEHLFRGELYSTNDAPLTFNNDSPPKLGDRVVSIVPTIAPFGLRGTVIVIHKATRYVEIIFDEEFVGGKNLQGYCSQFRGRLCSWSSLLKISTDDDWNRVNNRVSTKISSSTVKISNQVNQTTHHEKAVHVENSNRSTSASGRRITHLLKNSLSPSNNCDVDPLLTESVARNDEATNSEKLTKDSESIVIGHAPARLGGFTIKKVKATKGMNVITNPLKAAEEQESLKVAAFSESKAPDASVSHAPTSLGGFRIIKKSSSHPPPPTATESMEMRTEQAQVVYKSVIAATSLKSTESQVPAPTKPIRSQTIKSNGESLNEAMSKLAIMKSNGSGFEALSAASGNINLSSIQSNQLPSHLAPAYVGYIPDLMIPPEAPIIGSSVSLKNDMKAQGSNKKQSTYMKKLEAHDDAKAITSREKEANPKPSIVPSTVILKRRIPVPPSKTETKANVIVESNI